MKKNILFLVLFSFLINYHAFSAPPIGASITYKYIGNKKFEITATLYRDCRGTGMSAPTLSMMCVGGNSKNLTPTLMNIKDITPTCQSVGVLCNPPNTTISSGSAAIEEHIYADTIDFGGSESSYYSCGTIKLGVGNCCRNGAITTGAAGNYFWVTCTMELGKIKTNSSPVFSYPANLIASCNQPLYWSFIAKDTIDNDSLSYSFTDPLTSYTGKTAWGGGFSSQLPLTPYWPTGYDKSKGPKPDANPPIGIYLDPVSGMLITTPSNCNEMSIIAIAVKEWRKDTTGKYIQIGEIVRDLQFFSQTVNNTTPTLSGTTQYSICEGEPFSLTIKSSDKPYLPAPPAKSVLNDTVKISWQNDIKSSVISRDSNYVKQQAVFFSWTPKTGDARTKPYFFTLVAKDNNCTISAVTYKTYQINVYPKINVSSTATRLTFSDYFYKINIGNKAYTYFVTNNVKTNFSYDTRTFYFKSSKELTSDLEKDTVVFKKNGRFILNHFFVSAINCNTKTVSDTIDVSGVFDVKVSNNVDTFVCRNTLSRFVAATHNGIKPITYTWKSKFKTVSDTLGYLEMAWNKNDTISLTVKDAIGQTNSTYFNIGLKELPQITAGQDKISCPRLTESIVAKSLKADTLTWKWYLKGIVVSNKDSLHLSQVGSYIAKATNLRGCVSADTMIFSNHPDKRVSILSGQYCQSKNELTQAELFGSNSDPNTFFQFAWTLQKSLKKPGGDLNTLNDLLIDTDPSPKYNFKIRFDKSRVDFSPDHIDSLRFAITAFDSNGCVSKSNNTIVLVMPSIEMSFHSFTTCRNDSIDLNSKVLAGGVTKWYTMNRAGYEVWPKSGEIPNGILYAKSLNSAGGKYASKIIASLNTCSSSDSVDIVVYPAPLPKFSRLTTTDSVIYTDNSLYSLSRSWFLDNVNVGKNKILRLTKAQAEGKPLRLELSNSNCTIDTLLTAFSVGIKTVKNAFVKIYPNPANNYLTIEQLKESNTAYYQIYNPVGEIIVSGNLLPLQTSINLSNFASGPYFLKVLNENSSYTFQFMKSN